MIFRKTNRPLAQTVTAFLDLENNLHHTREVCDRNNKHILRKRIRSELQGLLLKKLIEDYFKEYGHPPGERTRDGMDAKRECLSALAEHLEAWPKIKRIVDEHYNEYKKI